VTGPKEKAMAAVVELQLMANLKLSPNHVLVALNIKPEERILVLGPEDSKAAWLEREFAVRFMKPANNGPVALAGDIEAVARAEAHVHDMLAKRRLDKPHRF